MNSAAKREAEKVNDVLITIKSTQRNGENSDVTEVITEGRYQRTAIGCEMLYNETEATGFEGSQTVVRIIPGERLEMTRSGSANTDLLIETGRKNYCRYGTPYGEVTIGAIAKKVEADIGDSSCSATAEYTMDINSELLGEYTLEISVK